LGWQIALVLFSPPGLFDVLESLLLIAAAQAPDYIYYQLG
jgi:hypothetical protein